MSSPSTLRELCEAEGLSPDELDEVLAWALARASIIVTEIAPDSPLLELLAPRQASLDRPPARAPIDTAPAPEPVDAPPPAAVDSEPEPARTRRPTLHGLPIPSPPPPPPPRRVEPPDAPATLVDASSRTDPPARPDRRVTPESLGRVGTDPKATLYGVPVSAIHGDPPPARDDDPDAAIDVADAEIELLDDDDLLEEEEPATLEPVEHGFAPTRPSTPEVLRKDRRYRLEQPIRVKYERWDQFIDLYTKDISRGGVFVQTTDPPPLHTKVTLRMALPGGGVRELKVLGEVVHVVGPETSTSTGMPAGFGLQFVNVTPDRRRLLELVVEHARAIEQGRLEEAELASKVIEMSADASSSSLSLSLTDAEQQRLDELETAFEAAKHADDRALLHLGDDPTPEEIRAALALASQQWQHEAYGREMPSEIRNVARAMIRRLELAAENVERSLRGRPVLPPDGVPEPVFNDLTPIGVPQVDDASDRYAHAAADPPASTDASEPRATADDRRRPTGLKHRLAKMLGLEQQQPVQEATTRSSSDIFDDAIRAINDKRYLEAVEILASVTRRQPGNARALVLMRFAEARLLVKRAAIPDAIEKYEEVLRLDPRHRAAQRDLAMLRCLH